MILKANNVHSLEHQLKIFGVILLGAFSGILVWLFYLLELSSLLMITLLTVLLPLLGLSLNRCYYKIITPFYSLTNQVEAIRLEDYSLHTRAQYHSGILHNLHQEITVLAQGLQQRKQTHDQHTLLIYHLIEQLDAPIAIFNQNHQLSHGNGAFAQYIGHPWQSKRLSTSRSLGLSINKNNQYSFIDKAQSSCWQLKQSQFSQDEKTYYLVVLTNIETLLRKNQQNSWQQIIRVLSHEIRNSLTPIKSLAQTLVELPEQQGNAKRALQVIVERSTALQEFVNRYGDISQRYSVEKKDFASQGFAEMLIALFAKEKINIDIQTDTIFADPLLLQQVMINLFKNAIDACINEKSAFIKLTILSKINHKQAQELLIEVTDNGQGIANLDNLFVPFYTTKESGHGIGLNLCQNIIEQHNGRLTLTNNKNKGATAQVVLPYE